LWSQNKILILLSGSESVNPAVFSEAEQRLFTTKLEDYGYLSVFSGSRSLQVCV
jgi:hypothetical protein